MRKGFERIWGKGRIGHRLYIGGKRDKKENGIFRDKR